MAQRQRKRVTIEKDDVARVDMSLDEDGDIEISTWFREGNRWVQLEEAPTIASPRAFLAGLIELGVLGLTALDAQDLRGMVELSIEDGVEPPDVAVGAVQLSDRMREAADAVLAKAPPNGWTAAGQ